MIYLIQNTFSSFLRCLLLAYIKRRPACPGKCRETWSKVAAVDTPCLECKSKVTMPVLCRWLMYINVDYPILSPLFLLVRSFQLFNTWLYRLKSKHVLPPPSPSVNVEPPSAFIAIKETHFELVGHHLHRSAVHTSACLGTSFWSHCFLWSNCILYKYYAKTNSFTNLMGNRCVPWTQLG